MTMTIRDDSGKLVEKISYITHFSMTDATIVLITERDGITDVLFKQRKDGYSYGIF